MSKSIKVRDHIAGSYVVVELTPNHYIDARKDCRTPNTTHIEIVRNGFVYYREAISNTIAPERVIELAKERLSR